MMRAALALVVLTGCSASNNDFPPRSPGSPTGDPSGTGRGDAGVGDGGNPLGDGGFVVQGRVCVVHDLRTPTDCDDTVDVSHVKVLLGNRATTMTIDRNGEFSINAGLGTDLTWLVTQVNFITTVMPFGLDHTIPIVPEALYQDLLNLNSPASPAVDQGSVLVRVVNDAVPAAGVTATSTLTDQGIPSVRRYDEDNSATDWNPAGSTQKAGMIWIPVADVTDRPGRITLTPMGGPAALLDVDVRASALTFVTHDLK